MKLGAGIMKKTKNFIIGCIIVIMAASMISCGKNNEKKEVKELSGKINIWVPKDEEAVLTYAATAFKQKNPQVQINITVLNSDEVDKNLSSAIEKNEKLPDIITSEDVNLPIIIKKYQKKLLDVSSISGFKKSAFNTSQINNATLNNKLYAMPWYTDPLFIVYREDLFNALNIKSEDIKTWQQFNDIGKDKFIPNGKYMLPLNSFKNSLLYSAGLKQLAVNYLNKDGKVDLLYNFNNKPAITFYNLYQNKLFYDESKDNGEINSFINGNIVSLLCDINTLNGIESKYPNLKGKLNIEKLPSFEEGGNRDTISSGTNIVALKAVANNEAAMEFIKYLTMNTSNATDEFKKYGYISSNKDILTDSIFYKKSEFYNKKSIGNMAIDEMLGLKNINYSENFAKIRDNMLNELVQNATSNTSLNDSVLKLQENIDNNTLK